METIGVKRKPVRALVCILAVLVQGALGENNTTTPAPATGTSPASNGTLVLRIKINGVFVDLRNCTFTELEGVSCNSNLEHDVSVTRAASASGGTETWVIAMIVVNSVLVVIVMGVAIGSYYHKSQAQGPQEYPPEQDQQQVYGDTPGYPYAYSGINANGGKKVISVGLVRLPTDAVMA